MVDITARRFWLATVAAATALIVPTPLQACPFCAKLGKTLSDFVAEADLVTVVQVTDGKAETIEAIKTPTDSDPIVLAAVAATKPPQLRLQFARVRAGETQPFRTISGGTPELAAYLRGTARVQGQTLRDRIRWYYDNLDSAPSLIADDAYKSLSKMYTAELQQGWDIFGHDELRAWIISEAVSAPRIGFYGMLLGLAGDPADADFLASLVNSPAERFRDGRPGFLGGLIILDFDRGVELALDLLVDAKRDESHRRSALEALQFALTEMPRTDPFPILERMTPALRLHDVAPLVIDEMRKANYVRAADQIMALGTDPAAVPVQAAVVRFALHAPTPGAQAFLASVRAANPQSIIDAEQAIRFERENTVEPPRLRPRPPVAE